VRRQGDAPETIDGVVEQGESGLMGIAFDRAGRRYLWYTTANDNRLVRYDAPGAPPAVLVSGLKKAQIHDGGRLAVGPDGALYVGTGDAAQSNLAQDDQSLNGKILRVDTTTGQASVFSKGHRNVQGLCFAASGRFLATEHGPDRGDEVNELSQGLNGGWPGTTGNGIKNWTPTIAPAGCAIYEADLIPGWKGSMLFVTLKDKDLRRLTFNPDGSVASEEILFDDAFGRLRDVVVAPDGSVYVATSNKDGRGSPLAGDDRIIRIAPA
jgi:glucose/arabinose dehydrogenase